MKVRIICLLCLFLTACNLNQQYQGSPQAWIDAPLDGMVLPMAPYEVVAHASDPTGISQIEFNVNGTVIGNAAGSVPLLNAQQTWNPAAPGEYVIQARGMNAGGTWSAYAEVRVTILGETNPTPETTATLTLTPTLTVTATPDKPTLILTLNANCRFGPSQAYEVYTSVLAGQELPIEGTDATGTWWLVRLPTKERCFISASAGIHAGNINLVPVVEASPAPAPEQGCYVYDPNLQPICTFPCPANADPGGSCTP